MHLNDIPNRELLPGFTAKIVHGEKLSWAFWEAKAGAEVPEHQHPHEQIMHVVKGTFEFTLDKRTQTYTDGSIVVIPSNTPHAGRAITDCRLMDIFTPVREEYR